METLVLFGKFENEKKMPNTGTYFTSGQLNEDLTNLITWEDGDMILNLQEATEEDDDVTHEKFFGENISRLKKALFGKDERS